MFPSAPYSLAFVCIFLTASLSVLGQVEECDPNAKCEECLVKKIPREVGNNGTCVYEVARDGPRCTQSVTITEGLAFVAYSLAGCANIPSGNSSEPTTTAQPPTTTNGTTTTTVPPPTPPTNGTTTTVPTTTTTPTPSTNGTTVPTTPSPSTNGTTTTPVPSNSTTTAAPVPSTTPPPKPAPSGFAWGEFFGGIVFAAALSSLAYLIWRFYKARLDRNYHTFSNPTF